MIFFLQFIVGAIFLGLILVFVFPLLLGLFGFYLLKSQKNNTKTASSSKKYNQVKNKDEVKPTDRSVEDAEFRNIE